MDRACGVEGVQIERYCIVMRFGQNHEQRSFSWKSTQYDSLDPNMTGTTPSVFFSVDV